ncbi:MAG: transcriptional regulator [Gammaproteobacteria bacterium]|nr:transcriptional regulator [Gammaproteobacteria bacterium]MBU1724833.1 transcriptional regulator [Gammaproteobacteria bacterium]MBU2006504.1 transcriptional regulator [Gammaproteobacteria bacterium]
MNTTSIADALFTKTQQRVLATLFGKPDQSFYLNEIVRLANIGKGTVKRELERMTAAGLLTIKRIGNQNHYQANPDCPIYSELLGITRKTFGIADVIKAALLPLDAQIDQAFIYGSVAKEQDTASSDIDLMVISDTLPYATLMTALIEAEPTVGRPINPTIYTAQQIRDKLHGNNAFITRVLAQPKLWIKGSDDDIGKTG